MAGMLQEFGGGSEGKGYRFGNSTALSVGSRSVIVALTASLSEGSVGFSMAFEYILQEIRDSVGHIIVFLAPARESSLW